MNIAFNSDIAKALINGHHIPVPFVHQFVQEAYDTFQYAQKTFISNKDCESRIQRLEYELYVVKAALLDAEENLSSVEEELEESKENARIAQEQRNASNKKIEELQDELYKLKEQEEQDNKN